jgi:hypothetical protein
MYGGQVRTHLDADVSHVVIDTKTSPDRVTHLKKIQRDLSFVIVCAEWVKDSIDAENALDATLYAPFTCNVKPY